MSDIDQTLNDALAAEERELLRRIDEEPGHIEQVLALFGGRTGWVSAVLMATQTVLFVAGVWAAWKFFGADDALSALHWGLPATVLLITSLMIKLALWPVMQANRLRLSLKRLEVLVVQTHRR
ncbi:MAG: hypothetical protein Q8R45_09360 [Brevundimonas sp.]|uniref:DUF6768 family protein n=1 Tax=Brevundimonas sp. TaxID=1871086 RepID=UPI0027259286|nr:DUF6768 family protein [Brevundimonas sp.]MDO9589101.1 hypothetical protein [Brevundimonas sp.]MDP3369465.1 hypothetical protein [Brevundimonas sp.]MDP3657157.1 hypothetical protein [Brevundimonas sp.]MDZ4061334.1 DUF6768 family protein [Brevundimonas sp.]